MSDLSCTFTQFKQYCKELIDVASTLDDDELDNAVKCLNLSYLNLEGTHLERLQAVHAWQLTLKEIHAVDRLLPLSSEPMKLSSKIQGEPDETSSWIDEHLRPKNVI